MTQRDLQDAAGRIHADPAFRDRVLEVCETGAARAPRRRIFEAAVIAAAMIFVFFGVFFAPGVLKQAGTAGSPSSVPAAASQAESKGLTNVLLVGVDETGRSDLLMLLSLDQRAQSQRWVLTPFLRDLYVDVPGHGKNKLSAVYSFGGGELCAKTVSQNFQVDVKQYIVIDYTGAVKMIDRLGGLRVEITKDEAKLINQYSGEQAQSGLKEGTWTLTGKQALYFSRIRSVGGEFSRSQREQDVIAAAMKQLWSMDSKALKALAGELSVMARTNIDVRTATELSLQAYQCRDFPVGYFRPSEELLQAKNVAIDGYTAAALIPKAGYNDQLHRFLYEGKTS